MHVNVHVYTQNVFKSVMFIMLLNKYFYMYVGIFITTSSGNGRQVNNNQNFIEYQILSNVTLTCRILTHRGGYLTATEYQWNTERCFKNSDFNGGNEHCFPTGRTTQNVNGYSLTAEDSGTITCSITYDEDTYISVPFRLRITG